MEVSVTRLQLPWKHWPPLPFRNVRVKNFVRCGCFPTESMQSRQIASSLLSSCGECPKPNFRLRVFPFES